MSELVDVQSVPVAPPSGGAVEIPPAEPSPPPPAPVVHPPAAVMPTTFVPDSRPFDLSTPAPAPETPAPAPADNGDFEYATDGWKAENAAVSFIRGFKGRGVRVSLRAAGGSFAFYAKRTLRPREAGSPYKVHAFVRSVSPGMFVCLRAEEHTSGPTIRTERCVPASSGWQRLKLLGRATGKGTKVTFSLHVMAALGGKSFDVDGFRLG